MNSLLSERVLNTPQRLVLDPPLSDAEFDRFCGENEVVRTERTCEGVIVMSPQAGLLTGDASSEIIMQLRDWWKTHRRGRVVGSNTHFVLPDSSIKSPSAAYVAPEQLQGLTRDILTGKVLICPAFVIELLSETDSISETQRKMLEWQKNRTLLGWLIDPIERVVHVYAAGCEPYIFRAMHLAGKEPVDGFVLDLSEVYRCFDVNQ